MAINQLMERPKNSFFLSEWMSNQSNQVSFTPGHSPTMLSFHDPSGVYLLGYKCEWKIQLQGYKHQAKQTKAKSEPGLLI